MKALTLWEPWASLWAAGVKVHETRSRATSYRGLLYVHAANKWDGNLRALVCPGGPLVPAIEDDERVARRFRGGFAAVPDSLGCLVGIVEITACVPTSAGPAHALDELAGDWSFGRFAWRAADPVLFPEPIPCKGAQGLWTPPADVVRAVEALR